MERHEQIKQQCVDILNYYYVVPDTEFTLGTNERIDVVGYSKNRNEPDIGIEVELSSDFQHDASKLARTSSFQLRLIVTDHPDTLSLGKSIDIKGKIVDVIPLPDNDITFEKKIREYTNLNKMQWFNNSKYKSDGTIFPKTLLLDIFSEEIKDQELDVESAKEIIFRCSLGGVHVGNYSLGPLGTKFNRSIDLPKELLYLSARHLIFEARVGKSYESGKQSIYSLSQGAEDLAKTIVDERIQNRREKLLRIIEKFGKSTTIISLLGHSGRFTNSSQLNGLDPYLTVSTQNSGILRGLIEEFNIDSEIIYASEITAGSDLFKDKSKQVFSALIAEGLGNESPDFTSRGEFFGTIYTVPFRGLLRQIDLADWPRSSLEKKLKNYAAWVIIRAHNRYVPTTLFDYFESVGLGIQDIEDRIRELFKLGITSMLMKGDNNTIAVYDENGFNNYCESKIKGAMSEILDED
jgi:hypothetical protein